MLARKKSVIRKGMINAHYEAITSNIFAYLLVGPYLTGYLLHLGANAGQIGFVMSIPLLSNAIIVILSVYIMEKYTNRHKLSFITLSIHRFLMVATGLIPFVIPTAWWVPVFILLYIVLSFAGSLSNTPFTTMFADMVPTRLRPNYFGMRFAFTGIAASVTLLIAGWGLDQVDDTTGFALLYVAGFIFASINMIFIGKYPKLPYIPSETPDFWKYLYKPLKDTAFLKSLLFISFWVMAQGFSISFFSYVMLDVMKMNYSWMGISNTILAVVSIVAYVVWGRLNAKWPTRKLLLWMFPLNAISVILWGIQVFVPDTVMLIIVYASLGVSLSGFALLAFQFVMSDTPKKERPMYYAVYASMTGLFGFLGPLLGGRVLTYLEGWPLWYQEFGYIVAVGVIMLIVSLTVAVRIFGVRKKPA